MSDKIKFWGVVPTILQMSKDPTNFYVGRALWFSITFLYISVVYVVQISWLNVKTDFQCHGNISKACVAECFENHFTSPVLGAWYMVGFVFSSVFFVMEFIVSQKAHEQIKNFKKESFNEEKSTDIVNDANCAKTEPKVIIDLSQQKPLLAMYLVYFLVQMSVQVVFLVILFHYHRPLITKPIWCSTHFCRGPYSCVLMGTQEKMMSIVLLAAVSVLIMTFCVMFFLYTINVYIRTGVTLGKRYRSFIKS